MKRIYLAGPEVFLADAKEIGKKKVELCAKYGFVGCFPLDNEVISDGIDNIAFLISKANEDLLRSCDIVVANITPFRGPSLDPGTAFEIGFASALKIPIFAYSNNGELFIDRTRTFLNIPKNTPSGLNTRETDWNDMKIENFGLIDNLMIPGAIYHSKGKIFASNIIKDIYRDLSQFELCLSNIVI